jgi:hypothetical protein
MNPKNPKKTKGYNGKTEQTKKRYEAQAIRTLNTSEAEASLQGQHSLINRQLDLNAKVTRVGTNEAEEVAENTARLFNDL